MSASAISLVCLRSGLHIREVMQCSRACSKPYSFGGGSKVRNGRLRRCFARRLSLEQLEDRRVLANFTVTNLADAAVSGPGSAPGTLAAGDLRC